MQILPTAQQSTGNLTNTTTKNILAQMKKSTLVGCDIIVNLPSLSHFQGVVTVFINKYKQVSTRM